MEIFEIKNKDVAGRIGTLRTKSGELETPAFFPVLNPHLPVVAPQDLKKVGFDAIITNAYSIYKDRKLREKVLRKGLHEAYGWDGVIATDSGAFQLWRYRDFDVTNLEICNFQRKIETDIGVILDVPVGKSGKGRKKAAIRTTAKRAKEVADNGFLKDEGTILMGPLHGVPHNDLLKSSIDKMKAFPFKMFAVGSIVPLMKDYSYLPLAKSLLFLKRYLPSRHPLHLFGAGHPLALAFFTLLGFDTFDSASYAEFAKKNRYLTSQGSFKLKELKYLPCNCPVCSSWNLKELLNLNEPTRRHYLALHNLYAIKREINTIKQAIRTGRLWKLVAKRAESHPKLAKAYKWLLEGEDKNVKYLEMMDPVYKKRGLLLTRSEEFHRPQIWRYKTRIPERKYVWAEKAIITDPQGALEIPTQLNAQVFIVDTTFAIIPREIREVYPLFQHESFIEEISQENLFYLLHFIKQLKKEGIKEFLVHRIKSEKLRDQLNQVIPIVEYEGRDLGILQKETVLRHKIQAILNYQFGKETEKAVKTPSVKRSSSTGRIRKIYESNITDEEIEEIIRLDIKSKETKEKISKEFSNKKVKQRGKWLLATLVPHNYKVVPHPLLAWRLKDLLGRKYTVMVENEAEPFIREGKSVFAKFVSEASEVIRANDEVLVISEQGALLAIGNAVLGGKEMVEFQRGVAVENRWGCPKNS